MAVVGILFVVIAPLSMGALITAILRERTIKLVEKYAFGLLSLFALFLICFLIGLKLDFSLYKLERLFLIPAVVLTICGLPFVVKSCKDCKKIEISKSSLWVIVPAIFLAAVSYCYYAPSYVNDDTWEIVATTLAHGSIYEYSSMTGKLMQNGLPIFNKIYIMPMFFAVMCDFFKTSMRAVGGFIIPFLIYTVNMALVYDLGLEAKVKDIKRYMLVYMLLLMGGTYLPAKGIPVTAGYALLREAYTGYAVAYGVLIPLATVLFLKRRYLLSVLSALSIVAFVKLDRIFYALTNPIDAYKDINEAGKLIGLYLLSVAIAIVLYVVKKQKVSPIIFLGPEVVVSYVLIELSSLLIGKKKKAGYFIAVSLVILSVCVCRPFKDAETLLGTLNYEKEVKDTINELNLEGKTIWSSEEFMATVRRINGNVYTLYGRDDVSSVLDGVDYESNSEYTWDYYYSYKNMMAAKPMFYPSSLSIDEAIEKAYEEGMDILIK